MCVLDPIPVQWLQSKLWRDNPQVKGSAKRCRKRSWSHHLTLWGARGVGRGYTLERPLKLLNYLVKSPDSWNSFLLQRRLQISHPCLVLLPPSAAPSSALSKALLLPKPSSDTVLTHGFQVLASFLGSLLLVTQLLFLIKCLLS